MTHHDGAVHGECRDKQGAHAAPPDVLEDPVCGMTVQPGSPYHAVHEGREYFFCAARCR